MFFLHIKWTINVTQTKPLTLRAAKVVFQYRRLSTTLLTNLAIYELKEDYGKWFALILSTCFFLMSVFCCTFWHIGISVCLTHFSFQRLKFIPKVSWGLAQTQTRVNIFAVHTLSGCLFHCSSIKAAELRKGNINEGINYQCPFEGGKVFHQPRDGVFNIGRHTANSQSDRW